MKEFAETVFSRVAYFQRRKCSRRLSGPVCSVTPCMIISGKSRCLSPWTYDWIEVACFKEGRSVILKYTSFPIVRYV